MTSVLDRFMHQIGLHENSEAVATVATVATEDLHGFTRAELEAAAHPIEWAQIANRPEAILAFAQSLREQQQIEAGERPERFRYEATCKHCGPVWVPAWLAGETLAGCRWCQPRERGLPIPRPSPESAD